MIIISFTTLIYWDCNYKKRVRFVYGAIKDAVYFLIKNFGFKFEYFFYKERFSFQMNSYFKLIAI